MGFLPQILLTANMIFVAVAGAAAAGVAGLAAYDRFWAKDPMSRRYPVFGRFLPFIDNWFGQFWRVHIDTPDRDGKPFDRATINEMKGLAETGKPKKVPFGSTKNIEEPGTRTIDNCQFPPLAERFSQAASVIIGPGCAKPFEAKQVFNISAMSFGSLSKAAIEALSRGAAKAGCWLNTGEGGLAPEHLAGGADLIFQIGTAKFGVRDDNGELSDDKLRDLAAKDEIRAFEIKLAQGAKPGGGGLLPAVKVTPEIARLRGIPAGKECISPRRHKEAGNMSELLEMINRVRNVTGKPVGFKMVLGTTEELHEMCAIIKQKGKAYAPDFITLDGGEGGTGEAHQVLMDNVGRSIRETLPELSQILIDNGLKERIKIVASGKLVTAADVVWALAAGADFVNSARGFMFSLGCVMAQRCDQNTCPSYVTKHAENGNRVLEPVAKSDNTANYQIGTMKGVKELATVRGLKDVREFRPHHIKVKQADGTSKLMSEIYPNLKF